MKSVNQNTECKMYTVHFTRLCPFYHTRPRALSMTWKARISIFPDCRSLQTPASTPVFSLFVRPCRAPHRF